MSTRLCCWRRGLTTPQAATVVVYLFCRWYVFVQIDMSVKEAMGPEMVLARRAARSCVAKGTPSTLGKAALLGVSAQHLVNPTCSLPSSLSSPPATTSRTRLTFTC